MGKKVAIFILFFTFMVYCEEKPTGKEPIKNYFNINPSFEVDTGKNYRNQCFPSPLPDDGIPDGWSIRYSFNIPKEKQAPGIKENWGYGFFSSATEYFHLDNKEFHTGKYSLKLSIPKEISFYPKLADSDSFEKIYGVKPEISFISYIWTYTPFFIEETDAEKLEGKKCKFSLWIKKRDLTGKFLVTLIPLDEEGKGVGDWISLDATPGTKEEWTELSKVFVYPKNARRWELTISLYNHSSFNQIVWIDTLSLTEEAE